MQWNSAQSATDHCTGHNGTEDSCCPMCGSAQQKSKSKSKQDYAKTTHIGRGRND